LRDRQQDREAQGPVKPAIEKCEVVFGRRAIISRWFLGRRCLAKPARSLEVGEQLLYRMVRYYEVFPNLPAAKIELVALSSATQVAKWSGQEWFHLLS